MKEKTISDTLGREIYESAKKDAKFIHKGIKAYHTARIEWKVMHMLLEKFNLKTAKNEIITKCHEMTGHNRLPFKLFHEMYPNFPIWLIPDSIPYASRELLFGIPMSVNKSQQSYSKILTAYANALESVDENWLEEGRPIGLVFEVLKTGVPGCCWCFHNYQVVGEKALSSDSNNMVIVVKLPKEINLKGHVCNFKMNPGRYFIQPYDDVLNNLDFTW